MLTKKIKYTDYNGEEREETLYFNLNKAELMQWELSEKGGLRARLERIIESKDVPSIAKIFEEIIEKSYGIKSADGRRFIKNKEIFEEFKQTEAYSEFYMQLATDSKAAIAFVRAIIPSDIDTSDLGSAIPAPANNG